MRRTLALVCFFASGFAGLVDEVVWIKRSALAFGSTTFALSSVLAVFFGGLALGSEIFGRIARRVRRPVRVYALLELALAGMALLSLPAFGLLEGIYGHLYRAVAGGGEASGVLLAARVGLVALVLLPPTVAMGGTLPLFIRRFASEGNLAGSVGLLYGLNTLGAAAGAAAAGFWLIPALGLQGSIVVAAAANVLAGGLALSLKFGPMEPEPEPEAAKAGRADRRLRAVALLFLLTGMSALAAEVVWTRFLSFTIRNSVTTYTLALSTVLVGIVVGSWLAGRLWDRRIPLAPAFAVLQAGAGLVLIVLTGLSAEFWIGLGQGVAPFALLMLPPAILSGASFPLAVKLAAAGGAGASRSVGRLAALNTLGGIVGSLAAGFWLVPMLGTAASLRIVTGLSVLAAVLALLLDRPSGRALVGRGALAAAAIGGWFLLPMLSDTRLPHDYMASSGRVVDVAEGSGSTLAVVLRDGDRQLMIDRLWQGRARKSHQIVAAHVPALLHPAPREVLVIGLGVGQTASRFLLHDAARLDCVDIEPAIFPFVREHFDSAWLDDPRVEAVDDDGRTFVAHTDREYDLISVEVGQVFRPGVDAFYTREFYAAAHARLNPGGMVAQFVPLPFLGETEFRRILATFLETFPEAVLWYNLNELLLIGGRGAAPILDADRLAALRTDAALNADLAWSHWGGTAEHLNDPVNLAGGFLCGPSELAVLAGGAEVYVDDRPDLAYAAMSADADQEAERPLVDLLERHLTPSTDVLGRGAGVDAARAAAIRAGNLAELRSGAVLRRVRGRLATAGFEQSLHDVQEATRLHPGDRNARRMLGEILSLGGRDAEAAPVLQDVVDREPADVDARRALALALSRTGRIAEAVPHLMRILAAHPEDARAHTMLGACYADQGRLQEARRHFAQAVRLDPGDPDANEMLHRITADLARMRR